VAHITIEALVLAIVTGALSLLMALWFEEGVRRVLLPNLAAGDGLNRTAILAACAAALLAAVVASAAAAVQLPSTTDANGISGAYLMGDRRGVLQRGLLVIQVGVSVVLLAGLGMFGRSLYNLGAQDFGFRMDGVLMVDFPPAPGMRDASVVFAETIERVRMLPGVERATFIQGAPFASFHVPPISVPGLAEPPQVGQQLPYLIAATPDFLDIMGVEIVEGRGFTPQDDRGAPVVIVNQSMARGAWPGESALGKCIRIGFGPDFDPSTASGPPEPPLSLPCREVIGVARDVRQRSVVPSGDEDRLMQYFVPFSQVPPPPAAVGPGPGVSGLLVRAIGDIDVVAAALRKTIVSGRTDLPFLRVRPYRDILGAQMRPWLLGTQLLGIFAALALVVASVGLYAAFAHAVSIRRREMAIRLAVGARRARVVRLVLGDALRIAGIGVLLGCAGAAVAGRWAEALLFGTSPTDPFVLGGASVVMVAVAAAATLLPAHTASRTNPTDLLRSI
jgi:predicted permease